VRRYVKSLYLELPLYQPSSIVVVVVVVFISQLRRCVNPNTAKTLILYSIEEYNRGVITDPAFTISLRVPQYKSLSIKPYSLSNPADTDKVYIVWHVTPPAII